jgi:hypothetical protein
VFSHVCKEWRLLALATPSWWTYPLLHWPELGAVSLERSGDLATPDIWMNLSEETMHLVKPVFRKAATITKLQFDGVEDLVVNTLASLPKLPILEALEISLEDTASVEYSSEDVMGTRATTMGGGAIFLLPCSNYKHRR